MSEYNRPYEEKAKSESRQKYASSNNGFEMPEWITILEQRFKKAYEGINRESTGH